MNQKLLMAIYFYPRGGSSQVVRYLYQRLEKKWSSALYSGSLGNKGLLTNAETFYRPLNVKSLDYTTAHTAWQKGTNPFDTENPMQASLEDRINVPDTLMARLSPEQLAKQIQSWRHLFSKELLEPALAHLHHLTPMHNAVYELWKKTKIITHLHGTELKMIEYIRSNPKLPFGDWWIEKMIENANMSNLIITVSPHDRDLALELLSVPKHKVITIPNGVDIEIFKPTTLPDKVKMSYWKHWLVTDPQGWKPNHNPGTIRYTENDLKEFYNDDGSCAPILLFVGRFTTFKRINVLLDAYSIFKSHSKQNAPLIIWGGFPGEWEGEHPYEFARKRSIDGVFFSGWRGHDDLPLGLTSSNIFVAPSVREPFGQTYLEAMACALPVIATSTGGPASFINTEPGKKTGWLVNPDDPYSLANALQEAVEDQNLRETAGQNARDYIERMYSWDNIAEQFTSTYQYVLSHK
ncbi:glycosyltransferase family 4 protein [SAR202 cluster bacterium AC-409-J13_OGT_754m]|nr:glycosyltransferase family 4 protein [SAR202 cluster bacterium AC-409-J13_OGT_754m]